MNQLEPQEYRFEVAFSFASEGKRPLVRAVAELLRRDLGEGKVFLDEWFEHELAGQDAHIVLQNIYRRAARLVVVCICERYNEKPWPQEEWRAIQALERTLRDAADENKKRMRLLPLQFGDGKVDAIFETASVPDVRNRSPEEIATLILKRLHAARRRDLPVTEPVEGGQLRALSTHSQSERVSNPSNSVRASGPHSHLPSFALWSCLMLALLDLGIKLLSSTDIALAFNEVLQEIGKTLFHWCFLPIGVALFIHSGLIRHLQRLWSHRKYGSLALLGMFSLVGSASITIADVMDEVGRRPTVFSLASCPMVESCASTSGFDCLASTKRAWNTCVRNRGVAACESESAEYASVRAKCTEGPSAAQTVEFGRGYREMARRMTAGAWVSALLSFLAGIFGDVTLSCVLACKIMKRRLSSADEQACLRILLFYTIWLALRCYADWYAAAGSPDLGANRVLPPCGLIIGFGLLLVLAGDWQRILRGVLPAVALAWAAVLALIFLPRSLPALAELIARRQQEELFAVYLAAVPVLFLVFLDGVHHTALPSEAEGT